MVSMMRRMGITAIYWVPRTSQRHSVYFRLTTTGPNHMLVVDIAYFLMRRGFVYLYAILDWASRRFFNTLTMDFCLDAVPRAVA